MIILQRATLENKEEIAEIEKLADSKTYRARLGDEEIKNFLEKSSVFLIKNNDVCVGLIAYKESEEYGVYLKGLVIKEEFRGNGYAKEAINIILNQLSKYPKINLIVHPQNNQAIGLYLSMGFIIESWLDDHFGDGEPRLLLIKIKESI